MPELLYQEHEIDEPLSSRMDGWNIELDFDQTGEHNMLRDEAIANELTAVPNAPNVLRLYTWKPSAISLGYLQSDETVDREACLREGIDVVRRPTGGRAVLHADELTYCVVFRSHSTDGIYAVHNQITESLLKSLETLGRCEKVLTLSGRGASTKAAYQGERPTNIACFASTGRHEVLHNGRKVLGSAQRRFGDIVLQHGSILLGGEHLRLPEFLILSTERRSEMQILLNEQTTTLSEIFGRRITASAAAECLKEDFVEHFSKSLAGNRIQGEVLT